MKDQRTDEQGIPGSHVDRAGSGVELLRGRHAARVVDMGARDDQKRAVVVPALTVGRSNSRAAHLASRTAMVRSRCQGSDQVRPGGLSKKIERTRPKPCPSIASTTSRTAAS